MDEKSFDLNIEKILEDWEVYHALREIIANALDETILSKSAKNIEIKKNGEWWTIRDFGRGLNYHHLTQNENQEKAANDKVIGRFGVGLKDALATLYRNGVYVEIQSKYGCGNVKICAVKKFPKSKGLINRAFSGVERSGTEENARRPGQAACSWAQNFSLYFTGGRPSGLPV